MGEPIKQLETTYEDALIIPETIERTILNYKKAHHGYKLDDKEQAYVEYNTLREQRKDFEEVTIIKIQRLFDRDTQKEKIVYFQSSRVKDFNNNYVKCPIVEHIGVVPLPIANISNDAQNKIRQIDIIEKQNDYYIPFSKEKLIELFEVSKDRHKIVCYAGYTKPVRVNDNDTIDSKKIIWNQDRFVNANFNELMDRDPDVQSVLDQRNQFIIPNRVRDINTPKGKNTVRRVESLADLLPKKKKDSEPSPQQQQETISNDIQNDTQKEYEELINNKD